jgi:hypothetical protein
MRRLHIFSPVESIDAQAADEAAPCEHCGSFETIEIAGKFLCADYVRLALSNRHLLRLV